MNEKETIIKLILLVKKSSFIKFLEKRNKRKDAINVSLFKAYLKQEENTIRDKLGSNAFYVAKKRLKDNLICFLADQTFYQETIIEKSILKELILSRKFFLMKEAEIGFQLLKRVETKAVDLGDHALLNEIYHTYIQYSYLLDAKEQETIIDDFRKNQEQFLITEKRNIANAMIRRAFQTEELEGVSDLEQLFNIYQKELGTEEPLPSFKDILQIAQIADLEAAFKKNYDQVNLFFVEKINSLEGSSKDNEQQLIYHIDLLYLIANIYFRKKNFEKSLVFLSKMHHQMLRFNEKLFKLNYASYTTLIALNLNFSGKHQVASQKIDELLEDERLNQKESLNPILVRVMIHFQQGELKEAMKLFVCLNKSDTWYKKEIGNEWLLNKKYIEILLHIELDNLELVDSKIQSLLRQYKEYFKKNKDFQILPFLKLVKQYNLSPLDVTGKKFVNKVEQSIRWKQRHQEDIFLMCFYAWLKSKMVQKPLYEVTLDLVRT